MTIFASNHYPQVGQPKCWAPQIAVSALCFAFVFSGAAGADVAFTNRLAPAVSTILSEGLRPGGWSVRGIREFHSIKPVYLGMEIRINSGRVIEVMCGFSGRWAVVRDDQKPRSVHVSICTNDELPVATVDDAIGMQQSQWDLVKSASPTPLKPPLGIPPLKLGPGGVADYWAVVVLGHGIGILPTVILRGKERSVVVQLIVEDPCLWGPKETRCSDANDASEILFPMAKRILDVARNAPP